MNLTPCISFTPIKIIYLIETALTILKTGINYTHLKYISVNNYSFLKWYISEIFPFEIFSNSCYLLHLNPYDMKFKILIIKVRSLMLGLFIQNYIYELKT